VNDGMSQRELAERAGVPVTMISAYERDQRQPTLTTLLRLLRAAGFDLRLHLAAYDPHDDILAGLEAGRSESERRRRDGQLQAWRQATPADLADVIRSKESVGRPKDLRVLPLLLPEVAVALCKYCALNCRFGEIRLQSVVRKMACRYRDL
jgi:transcriptional regulator with XRE-family HTH domain